MAESLIEAARMSAAVKLQRAFDRERSKSDASRQRADQAKAEFEKEWKAKQEKEKGVAEGSEDSAEKYKAHLLKTAPRIMDFLAKAVKGWRPSEQEMLGAIDTAYTVMKHTGDVKQAGKAMMDELNTLHRMSQGQQGVAEGWKSKVAGAAMAAASLMGNPAHAGDDNANAGWRNLPDIVAHITMNVNGKTIEKEINLGTEYPSPMAAKLAVAKWLKEKGITNYSITLERVKPESNEGVSEEKQKGVDGKACWKGYKRMGTKKKGGRTVDNCVPIGEHWEQRIAKAIKLLESK
jgi:hypothetical protein